LENGRKKAGQVTGFFDNLNALMTRILLRTYFAAAAMYSTAALTSSSDAEEPPLAGIMPALPWKPLIAWVCSVAIPCLMRSAQAALSPNFGAPATPAPWNACHVASYSFWPAAVVDPAAAAAGAAAAGAAASAAGAVPAAF